MHLGAFRNEDVQYVLAIYFNLINGKIGWRCDFLWIINSTFGGELSIGLAANQLVSP